MLFVIFLNPPSQNKHLRTKRKRPFALQTLRDCLGGGFSTAKQLSLWAIMLLLLLPTTVFCVDTPDPRLKKYKEPPPPTNKILITSIPKAGTHLLLKTVELITESRRCWISLSAAQKFNPGKYLRKSQPIIASHLFPAMDIVRTQYPEYLKKVLIIRDPRDVMVSFMYHLTNQLAWPSLPGFDLVNFKTLSLDEKLKEVLLLPTDLITPQKCFAPSLLWMQDPTIFVCRFEDLVGPQGGGSSDAQISVIRDLAAYLEYPLSNEKLHSIIDQTFGNTWTFRKGQIGSWKEHFNEDNKQLFKTLWGETLIEMGYESNGDW